ncbi:MAG: histidine phosphatase family protein [Firmicutes bacterium]|nr:histidine phosphatase family protein [Bacillota bacterium]
MELIIVRHGETDANSEGVLLGCTDVSLNRRGIQQVKRAAKKLRELKVDRVEDIYSSPLKRAVQTAEIIGNELGCKKIIYSDDLKERNFGDWEGLTVEEISRLYENEYRLWINDVDYCMKNGEEVYEMKERIKSFTKRLIDSSKDDKYTDTHKREHGTGQCTHIIVTHLGCIRYMLAFLLGLPDEYSWRFRVGTGSLTRVCINEEGYSYLTLLNG